MIVTGGWVSGWAVPVGDAGVEAGSEGDADGPGDTDDVGADDGLGDGEGLVVGEGLAEAVGLDDGLDVPGRRRNAASCAPIVTELTADGSPELSSWTTS